MGGGATGGQRRDMVVTSPPLWLSIKGQYSMSLLDCQQRRRGDVSQEFLPVLGDDSRARLWAEVGGEGDVS